MLLSLNVCSYDPQERNLLLVWNFLRFRLFRNGFDRFISWAISCLTRASSVHLRFLNDWNTNSGSFIDSAVNIIIKVSILPRNVHGSIRMCVQLLSGETTAEGLLVAAWDFVLQTRVKDVGWREHLIVYVDGHLSAIYRLLGPVCVPVVEHSSWNRSARHISMIRRIHRCRIPIIMIDSMTNWIPWFN